MIETELRTVLVSAISKLLLRAFYGWIDANADPMASRRFYYYINQRRTETKQSEASRQVSSFLAF